MLVAPRTLQAIAADESLPSRALNGWLSRGAGPVNEPRNAMIATGVIAFAIVWLGSVDVVARLISMFFMVTYGSLCAISFLEHFAARPSYRPSFRTRWYVSLFGAVVCFLMMFQMDPLFATLALLTMTLLYRFVRAQGNGDEDGLAAMFRGVMTQLTRFLHVRLQRHRASNARAEWRPSIIMVDDRTFDRSAPLQLLTWLSHRHGFGTYLHYIPGVLDSKSYRASERVRRELVKIAAEQDSNVYVDTIISPSFTSAFAQSLQIPGVAGIVNNMTLFELSVHDPPEFAERIVAACSFAAAWIRSA